MGSKCTDADDGSVQFSVDSALLRVITTSENLALYTQSTECYSCNLVKYCNLNGAYQQLYVNTTFETNFQVVNATNNNVLCSKSYWFGEQGIYNLTVTGSNGNYTCSIDVEKNPINSFYPILTAFFVYLGLILIYNLFRFAKRKLRFNDNSDEQPLDNQISQDLGNISPTQKPRRKRLRSLDTFRGVSIVVMIFVNYGGGDYWFFNHSAWNGLTIADLVFPWFLFIMGTSMSMAFEGITRRNAPLSEKIWTTIRRSITLFLLGIMINSADYPDLKTIRIFGVLQRFGVAYLILGLLRSLRAVPKDTYATKYAILIPFQDIISIWVEWVVGLALIALWLLLTFLLPVPGCPTGYLGPGGLSDGGSHYNCTGGAAQLVDRTILSTYHMYQTPTCKPIYDTIVPYDPEGIMGCLTSTFIVLLGLQAGQIVLFFSNWRDRMIRWATWAIVTGTIAAVLCEGEQNGGWIPINKNLWSLSYVLAMACFAFICLIVFLFIIDLKNYWSGAPFYQAGMNSILLYLGHEIMQNYLPFSWIPFTQTHWEYLAMNLWGASLWALIAVYLDHKRYYFSV